MLIAWTRRALLLALFVSVCATPLGRAQSVATSTPSVVISAPPALTSAEMEDFLLHARIGATKRTLKGVTGARQVTLSDGRVTHDAQVQDVDVYKPIFAAGKYTETNFRDTYRYNIAAYRLSLLLGLHNVPMSVLRTVKGKPAAVTWWIDDAMDEGDRQKKKPVPYGPDPARTAGYFHILRVFDELIQNRDRNTGNMMWTPDWTFWMVDHTRAFRLGKELLKPNELDRCERSLLDAMRALTRPALRDTMVNALTNAEIDALLARRDVIVKLFDGLIAQRGEATVLFTQER